VTPAPGRPARPGEPARRPRLSRLRALPLLARPIIQTMPWVTLLTGCLAGVAYLAVLAHFAGVSHQALRPGNVRLAFVPAVAALAFVPRTPVRPLAQTTPVPAWVAPAGYLLLAVPVLAVTCWAQLLIMDHAIPPHTLGSPPAVYPLIAQLTGWCAITAAAAACVGRSRYADLGGAIAVPVSFGAIALAWYVPVSARLLAGPSATAHGVTIGWYVIASAAFVLTCAALRDQWHRYSRKLLMTFRLTGRCRGPRLAARRGRPIRCRAPGGGKTSG